MEIEISQDIIRKIRAKARESRAYAALALIGQPIGYLLWACLVFAAINLALCHVPGLENMRYPALGASASDALVFALGASVILVLVKYVLIKLLQMHLFDSFHWEALRELDAADMPDDREMSFAQRTYIVFQLGYVVTMACTIAASCIVYLSVGTVFSWPVAALLAIGLAVGLPRPLWEGVCEMLTTNLRRKDRKLLARWVDFYCGKAIV